MQNPGLSFGLFCLSRYVLLWLCPASVVLFYCRASQRTGNFGTRIEKTGCLLHLQPEQIPAFAAEMKTLSGMHLDTLLQAMILYNFHSQPNHVRHF